MHYYWALRSFDNSIKCFPSTNIQAVKAFDSYTQGKLQQFLNANVPFTVTVDGSINWRGNDGYAFRWFLNSQGYPSPVTKGNWLSTDDKKYWAY